MSHRQELIKTIQLAAKDKELLDEFLQGLLTPAEYEDIIKRLQIVKELKKGTPQREIAEKLDVSVSTVSRGSNELKDEDSAFHKILELLNDE